MKISQKEYIVIYLISFLITWLLFILYIEKEDFDIEYKEKTITEGKVFNLDTYEVLEELYDGRKATNHIVGYLEYSYTVNGKKYKYGSSLDGLRFRIGDKIKVEYVKENPRISRRFGSYNNNFFRKNLVAVIAVSFFVMFGVLYLLSLFKTQFAKYQKDKFHITTDIASYNMEQKEDRFSKLTRIQKLKIQAYKNVQERRQK